VGRDAVHAARLDPARFEPSPKRRIDRDTVRLGDQDVSVTAMIAAVLGRVKDEAVRVTGARVDDLTLTHPAGWSGARVAKLVEACRAAGLPDPAMVPEPVAAAGYFVTVLGRSIPAGSALVVYDFGGGTFDASAVTPSGDGYEVLAVGGLDNLGGVDLDAALLEFVATVHRGQNPDAWQRLEDPQTPADRRHRRHLIEDVRAAKEMLSRAASAMVPVPLLEMEARVSREEFDALARPLLDRTVATTTEVIRSAKLPPERIAAVLLVGGSSASRWWRRCCARAPAWPRPPSTNRRRSWPRGASAWRRAARG
jgi:molecular chaperone DnaK (HSP70)